MINTQMADKLPELKDQFLVQYILGEIVNQVCNCEMIEQNSIDEMEDYPFVTINWIDPGTLTTADWLGEHKQYLCSLQIDVHATQSIEALQLSEKLFNALHEDAYRRFFKQAHILPESITNTSNRTALSGINYDQDFGFDCSFSIVSGYVYQPQDLNFDVDESVIESVEAKSKAVGSTINSDINAKNQQGGN